jgi:hypothetical protein
MIFWLVYSVLFLASICFFMGSLRAYLVSRHRRSAAPTGVSHLALETEKQIAVLEAQYVVAPGLALEEVRTLLGPRLAPRDSEYSTVSPADFYELLLALTQEVPAPAHHRRIAVSGDRNIRHHRGLSST